MSASPYRSTLSDRFGPDVYDVVRAVAWSLPVAVVVGVLCYLEARGAQWGVLLSIISGIGGLLGTVGSISLGVVLITHGSASSFLAILWPSGKGTPSVQEFSKEQAMVMQGDVSGAIASFERHLATYPNDAQARVRAADLYLLTGNIRRARDLFEATANLRQVPSREQTYAVNRLIDLYLGPLAEEPRARIELKRIAEQFQLPEATRAAILDAQAPS